jgi:hypothetical protein
MLLLAGNAMAGDLAILGAVSKHSHGVHHEAHPTLGWVHEYDDRLAAGVAVTRNSLGYGSVYLAGRWTPMRAGPVRFGGSVILASGYEHGAVLVPAVSVVADIGKVQPMLSVVPPLYGGPTIAILSMAWRFQ